MQSETIVLQTTYLAGRKKGKPLPARATTVMGTRLTNSNSNGNSTSKGGSVRFRHQHSNSTPSTGTHHHHHHHQQLLRAPSASVSSSRHQPPAPSPPTRPPPVEPPAPRPRSHSTSAVGETATVLVGRQRARFVVPRQLLCATSPFFRTRLLGAAGTALWLPTESATMFGLFVEWLRDPRAFRAHLDHAIAGGAGLDAAETQLLHWALVRLHLFAAHAALPRLQDLAMDAVQDLYLRRDWDVAPALVAYLYVRCDARHAGRLRRWAVAMLAFSLAVTGQEEDDQQQQQQRTSSAVRLRKLLVALPELAADYAAHVRGMRAAALDLRFKNPQLRIPANALRSDKRAFGFRECSFHSHRAAVGQGACPHSVSGPRAADAGADAERGRGPVLDMLRDGGEQAVVVVEDEDEEADETMQWEKEWADEFEGWEAEPHYTYATTSLRRAPPEPEPESEPVPQTPAPLPTGTASEKLMSKFGTHGSP